MDVKMKDELGIYIHIPFCKQKCYYCDFISFSQKDKEVKQYVECLKKEIIANKEKAKDYKINTIYIGGGTPSYIDSSKIVSIIETIYKNYDVEEDAEITIEINPGTVNKEKLQDYKKAGINRISIGLQSTNNDILKTIGRIHTYEQFLDTYKLARGLGFSNINVDLMLALPNQTEDILEDSLQKIINLNPEHISLYSLILEEDTKLCELVEDKKVELPNEETERKMYWQTKNILEKNGYIHYEISNFAKEGKCSKHNLNCWNQKPYIGFGVSAHSYFGKTRYSNTQDLKQYIQYWAGTVGAGLVSAHTTTQTIHETQTLQDEQKEYMLLGLRKIQGISIKEFKTKFTQNPIYIFRKELDKLVTEELIEIDIDNIKLTDKGLDFANQVWEEFV